MLYLSQSLSLLSIERSGSSSFLHVFVSASWFAVFFAFSVKLYSRKYIWILMSMVWHSDPLHYFSYLLKKAFFQRRYILCSEKLLMLVFQLLWQPKGKTSWGKYVWCRGMASAYWCNLRCFKCLPTCQKKCYYSLLNLIQCLHEPSPHLPTTCHSFIITNIQVVY